MRILLEFDADNASYNDRDDYLMDEARQFTEDDGPWDGYDDYAHISQEYDCAFDCD